MHGLLHLLSPAFTLLMQLGLPFSPGSGLDSPALEKVPEKEEEAMPRELGDAVDCHLADMLQQLTAVNAAKPSERVLVRQGEPRGRRSGGLRCSGVLV